MLNKSGLPSNFTRLLSTSSSNNTRKTVSGPSKESSDSGKESPGNENEQKTAFIKLLLLSLFVYGVFIYPMTRLADRIEVQVIFVIRF